MNRLGASALELTRVVLPLAILAVGVGGFLLFGQRPEVVARPKSEDTGTIVHTAAVQAFSDEMVITVDGVAVPHRQVTLSAQVAGQVVRKDAKSRRGSYVEAGEFLLQIDPTDYALEVARMESDLLHSTEEVRSAEVDIANSESLVALAREDLALRQRDLTRRRTLFEQKATSESELDESLRLELASRNALQTLLNQTASFRQRKSTLEAAKELVAVQRRKAGVDEARTRVESPLAGTVTMDYVEQDDYVNRGDPLILLSDPWPMEIKCSLRVDQLYWLWTKAGQSAGAESDSASVFEVPITDVTVRFQFEGAQYEWEGVLARYEGSGLDPDTRLVPCRVRVDNPTEVKAVVGSSPNSAFGFKVPSLFSGMYVTVRIPIAAPIPLIAVPREAIRPGGRLWVMKDGKLAIEQVDVAMTTGDQVVLRQPLSNRLQPGDRVVTSPLPVVRPGMLLKESTTP